MLDAVTNIPSSFGHGPDNDQPIAAECLVIQFGKVSVIDDVVDDDNFVDCCCCESFFFANSLHFVVYRRCNIILNCGA